MVAARGTHCTPGARGRHAKCDAATARIESATMRPAAVIAANTTLGREGLAAILTEDFDVVAFAQDAAELLDAVDKHRPAIAVIEGRLPPTRTGEQIRAAMVIRARYPEVATLIVSRRLDLD